MGEIVPFHRTKPRRSPSLDYALLARYLLPPLPPLEAIRTDTAIARLGPALAFGNAPSPALMKAIMGPTWGIIERLNREVRGD